jgi:hypothetical protein
VWSANDGSFKYSLADGLNVLAVAFTPDGQRLIFLSHNRTLGLCDAGSGATLSTLRLGAASTEICTASFSPDCHLVAASVNGGRSVAVWDTASGCLQENLTIDGGAAVTIAFSANNRRLAFHVTDGSTWVYCFHRRLMHCISNTLSEGFLRFQADDRHLAHRRGVMKLADSVLAEPPANESSLVEVKKEWLTCNGRRLLWLPTEYRPTCMAINNGTIAFGITLGKVIFLNFQVADDGGIFIPQPFFS